MSAASLGLSRSVVPLYNQDKHPALSALQVSRSKEVTPVKVPQASEVQPVPVPSAQPPRCSPAPVALPSPSQGFGRRAGRQQHLSAAASGPALPPGRTQESEHLREGEQRLEPCEEVEVTRQMALLRWGTRPTSIEPQDDPTVLCPPCSTTCLVRRCQG